MSDFHLITQGQEIIFGTGSIAALGSAVERGGWRRLLVFTSPSQRRSGHLQLLQALLDDRLVATYDQVKPHVQEIQVAEAAGLAAECQVDAVVGFGGGSPIGMAKAVSLALEERRGGPPAGAAAPAAQPLIPVIAVPTTYAGSEMTPVYGVTRPGDPPRKTTVRDPRIAPRLVIYDPELTLDLPPALTASSGINALAHCVEALYSTGRNPLASAAAQAGIESIVAALPMCFEKGDDRAARYEMLTGSHLAAVALSLTRMGLHHGLCHVLGGSAGVPHGLANSVILPYAMAFNQEVAASELAQVARAMALAGGSPRAAEEVAAGQAVAGVAALIARLGLPQRLREVGVNESDLPGLAALALQSRAVRDNPRPVTDAAQLEAVLRAAW